ncbi:DUF1062 domain-containing protein [Clostridium felsineum]|uniref:DUF1062 domain-containing protein n=1 Tax=Clostridium felsineum TaxID=36839 RepID=UPI00098C3C8A|nr:DUF1062 domain-containing protein [Clostridium felsineum]URZ02687.1 hypothetical protein CLAUR_027110 [Clostridium felsineum]
MKKVTWELQYISPPPTIKYCKKCGKKTEYICSDLFRVNAQRKYLDVWLIYKCSNCNSTWNMTIYSRINPKSIDSKLLEGFYCNDEKLAEGYAMNSELVQKNGGEFGLPKYKIVGEDINFNVSVELNIKSKYLSPIKLSSVLREKLNLSQKGFEQLVIDGEVKSAEDLDLKKCKIKTENMIIIKGRVERY